MVTNQENFTTNIKKNELINTFFSADYCKPDKDGNGAWTFSQALREYLQNQKDEIVIQIGSDNLKVEVINFRIIDGQKIEEKEYLKSDLGIIEKPEKGEELPNETMKLSFKFVHKITNEEYGEILYDSCNNQLTIWNKGKLETGDLLTGVAGKSDNKEAIGRFGEGMKLASLCLLRKKKNFNIISNGKIWSYELKKDDFFKKNNIPQECLFFKWDDINLDEYKGKVTVIIENISPKEWAKEIDNYLWLSELQRQTGVIDSIIDGKTHQLLLNSFFKHKIYVKGIFVQNTPLTHELDCFYGFNVDIKLDRDRNAIKDSVEKNQIFSRILADIMNRKLDNEKRTKEIYKNLSRYQQIYFNTYYIRDLHYIIKENYYVTHYIIKPLSIESCKKIWEQEFYDDNTHKYILYAYEEVGKFNNWKNEKNLDDSFYPYRTVYQWVLNGVLKKSNNNISYIDLFNKDIIDTEVVKESDVPANMRQFLIKIVNLIKFVKSDFKITNIQFKKLKPNYKDTIYYFDSNKNIIYFSNKLFETIDDHKKSWMFTKCSDSFKINLIDLLRKTNNI